MSLKAFHLVFILASTLLSAGFGAWCFRGYTETESGTLLAMGIVAFSGTGALIVYIPCFLKKLKNVSFLAWGAILLVPQDVWACATCFGNPDSPLVKSANAGIAFLMAVIGTLLMGFAGLFIFWIRRARKLDKSGL